MFVVLCRGILTTRTMNTQYCGLVVQEIDSDQDGFTDAGAVYSGSCSDSFSESSCVVNPLGDDQFPTIPPTNRQGWR